MDMFLSLDAFGEDVGFTVGNGQRKSRGFFTTLLSILIYSLLIGYALQKHNLLMGYDETTFLTTLTANKYLHERFNLN